MFKQMKSKISRLPKGSFGRKGEVDKSLLIAAVVAAVAIIGLVFFFNQSGGSGAANVVIPATAPTYQQAMYDSPILVGDKVKMQQPLPAQVEVVGRRAAYDSYLWCRQADNWQTQKEKSQCCNVKCATECMKTYGEDNFARGYQTQDLYDMCKTTWCEDQCRAYMWQEYDS